MKQKTKGEQTGTFRDIAFAVKTLIQASPRFIFGGIVTMTAYWFFTAYVQEVLFLKKLLEIITEGGTFRDFMGLLLMFCVAALLAKGTDCLGDYFSSVGGKVVYKKLNEKIFRKAAEVDIECYENPEFYDVYKRATEILTDDIYHGVQFAVAEMVSGTFSGIFLIGYVATVDPKLLLILLSVAAVVAVQGRKNRLLYQRDREMTPNKRQKSYVQRVVFLRDYAKDMRTSDIYRVMQKRFHDAIDANRAVIGKYGPKLALFEVFAGVAAEVVPVVVTYSYAAYRFIVKKNLKVADFSVLMTAINNIKDVVRDVSGSFADLQERALYFRNLKQFLAYESHVVSGEREAGTLETLEFRNVTFTYPGAEKPSLQNVSLSITAGETVAVVGKNGAGKSTFVKLLLRFYDPDEGEILWNGVNLREYDLASVRKQIGTVFQDYKVFALTVNENVLCRECENEQDRKDSEQAMIASGAYAKVSTLPNGADTVLTREFDDKGAGLSGGEQQKIAAARMFARPFALAVLDEPSSALDPIAEYKMYESLLKATENKTVVYISHRLSSAVLSDKIFVFDAGTVTESGTHDELTAKGGLYASMFAMQASAYRETGEEETP